jgi:hypothetical protein
MKGSVTEPLKHISDAFDVTEGLRAEELLIGKNIGSIEYLFTVSAIAFASDAKMQMLQLFIQLSVSQVLIPMSFLIFY